MPISSATAAILCMERKDIYMDNNENLLTYKGHPLVRNANKIYYGEPYNKAMIVLTILENTGEGEAKMPSRILVQLQSTDPALAMKKEKILNEVERKTLADALNIGAVWLEKQLN